MESLTAFPKRRYKVTPAKPSSVVRVGIIGCGYWGPNLIRNFHEIPSAEIIAICDSREERLRPFHRKFPTVKLSTRYQDLLSNPLIDAIVVATPVSTHYEIARRALLAGKHVLVEKPLVQTARQGNALLRLASRLQRILMVGHTFEYHPAVLKVADLLRAGELGKLYYIDSIRVNLGLYQSDGLNVIWDLAPHDISIILHWVGEIPRQVSAWGQGFVQKKPEDVAFIRLEFPGGVLAHIHVSWLAPTKIRRITVVGDKKMVVYDDLENVEKIKVAERGAALNPSSRELRVDYRVGNIVSPHVEVKEPLAVECSHFVDCILHRRNPQTDGEKGVQVVRVLEAAERSMRRGSVAVAP